MIYCVVPQELADELYEKLTAYYADDPNVEVIVDRRKAERRGADRTAAGPASGATAGASACRASSRSSIPKTPEALPVRVVVHVDGGARGNPGPAAIGAVVSTPEGEVLDESHARIGDATNNVAEYRGLLHGLERARALGATEVEIVNDSELVARQVAGQYKVKQEHLKPLHARGAGRAGRVRALEHPLGAARAQRARRRARQRGARLGMSFQPPRPAPTEEEIRRRRIIAFSALGAAFVLLLLAVVLAVAGSGGDDAGGQAAQQETQATTPKKPEEAQAGRARLPRRSRPARPARTRRKTRPSRSWSTT